MCVHYTWPTLFVIDPGEFRRARKEEERKWDELPSELVSTVRGLFFFFFKQLAAIVEPEVPQRAHGSYHPSLKWERKQSYRNPLSPWRRILLPKSEGLKGFVRVKLDPTHCWRPQNGFFFFLF